MMIEEIATITFTTIDEGFPSLSSREGKEALLQWNLDASLDVKKFRFNGTFNSCLASDYERLIKDFLSHLTCTGELGISGSPDNPLTLDMDRLETTVLTMEFFDRLKTEGIVTPSGGIRGCFEEVFDGISVGDQLREMLLNEDSEKRDVFNAEDKQQLLYHVFKTFCIGGAMCQPDNNIERYLDITKRFYKEVLTVYRDAKTEQIQVSGKAFEIRNIAGLTLHPQPESSHNSLVLIIDPLKKYVIVIKNDFKPYW